MSGNHVWPLHSCCLDCLEDVHSTFNFDSLNFRHTSDEHPTARHAVTTQVGTQETELYTRILAIANAKLNEFYQVVLYYHNDGKVITYSMGIFAYVACCFTCHHKALGKYT